MPCAPSPWVAANTALNRRPKDTCVEMMTAATIRARMTISDPVRLR